METKYKKLAFHIVISRSRPCIWNSSAAKFLLFQTC